MGKVQRRIQRWLKDTKRSVREGADAAKLTRGTFDNIRTARVNPKTGKRMTLCRYPHAINLSVAMAKDGVAVKDATTKALRPIQFSDLIEE